jgi:hypothetical protein
MLRRCATVRPHQRYHEETCVDQSGTFVHTVVTCVYFSSELIHVFACGRLQTQGDIVLIGLREFQQEKADIIHKYSADEARSLQAYGELPMHAKINQTAIDIAMVGGDGQEEDVGFDFEEVWNPHDVIVVFVRSFHERYLCVLCVQI